MANDAIARLLVILGADDRDLRDGLKSSETTLSKFVKSVGNVSAELFNLRNALIVVGATAAMAFAKRMAEAGDQVAKTAKQLNITTDSLQELRYAATLGGTKTEDLDQALGELNKRLGDVNGGVTEAMVTLGKLGFSIDQIKGRGTDEVFKMIADRIGQVRDPMERARITTELFGKAGQDLLPTLMQGSAHITALGAEAKKLGLVLSEETIKKSEEANAEFIKIGNASKIAGVNIAVGFLPALEEIRKLMTSKDFQDGVKTLGANFGALVTWIVAHRDEITMAATAFAGLKLGVAAGSAFGKQGAIIGGAIGAFAGLAAGVALTETEVDKLNQSLKLMESQKKSLAAQMISAEDPKEIATIAGKIDALNRAMDEARAKLSGLKAEAAKPTDAAPTAQITVGGGIQQYFPQVTAAVTDLQFKTRELNQDFVALAPGFAQMANGLKLFGTDLYPAVTSVGALHPQLQLLNQAMLMFKGAQMTQENLLPWQQYELQIARIQQLMDAGAISSETYARAMRGAAEKAGTSWNIAGASIAGSFATIAGSFGESNSAMATAAKAFGIAQAVISTYTGMAKALELPFPANIAAVAQVAAQGFAFVASIKSTQVPKFATGGSFTVGGAGGLDSQRVMMDLNPGEMVDITPAQYGQNGGGSGGGGGGDRVLSVQGISPREYYRGDVLTDLLDNVAQHVRDGYQLKLAGT